MEIGKAPNLPAGKANAEPLHMPLRNGRYQGLRTAAAFLVLFSLAIWHHAGSWSTVVIDLGPQNPRQRIEGFGENDSGLTDPWVKLTPSRNLEFSSCFNGHQCARLSVPMDWNGTISDAPRVNLAIIKRPAKVPITDPRYGGLLWLQPGGPGSSGVNFLLRHGKTVQMIVDSPLDPSDYKYKTRNPPKYFDVLGFDPRGVNNTTPHISCFPNTVARDVWALQADAEGVLGSSDLSFTNIWARATALSEGCTKRIAESEEPNEKLPFHMNTSPVVADIVEVIEQHGKWREAEAGRLMLAESYPKDGVAIDTVIEQTRWRKGEEKLLYWGLSYGTIIGATFATMQPHRIERAIIDGVGDTSDYYSGQWRANLQDTDRLLDKLSEYCDRAGQNACALYTQGGPATIKHRFRKIVEHLRNNPVSVIAQGSHAPDIVTFSDVRRLISQAVYVPIQLFATLASILADLNYRNGTAFANIQQSNSPIHSLPQHCQHAAPYSQECAAADRTVGEISIAILCSDGNGTYGIAKEAYMAYVAELEAQSWLMGDLWAEVRLGCVGWDIKPKWRFGGPFGGNTAKDMLIVGTKYDPVTPIRNAHALAERFPDSGVLTVDAEGHTIMSSPSLCMAHHIRAYFQSGRLPDSGTVCDDNEKPFLGVTKRGKPEEEALLEQLRWTASHLLFT